MQSNNLQAYKLNITKQLLHFVKRARSRYLKGKCLSKQKSERSGEGEGEGEGGGGGGRGG